MNTTYAAQIDDDARMIAMAELAAERAAAKQPRQACKPTTPADLHRLAEQGAANGVTILKAPGISSYFALSGSTPGLIYPVDAEGGCTCQGYQRVARCQHYAYLLAVLDKLPQLDPDPDPEPIAPALPAVPAEAAPFVTELIALRRPWDDLARSIASAKRSNAAYHELDTLLSQARAMRGMFDTICDSAAAYGVSRELLREVWRNTVPAPAPEPGAAASSDEVASLVQLEAAMIAARDELIRREQIADEAHRAVVNYIPNDYECISKRRRAAEEADIRLMKAEAAYERAARHYTIAANGDEYNAAIAA